MQVHTCVSFLPLLFLKNYIVQCKHSQHTYTHPYEHCTQTLPYEHLGRTEPVDHEIHEVTTGASLSTGRSPATESIAPLNSEINLGKYEHLYQVKDLNPDKQVPSQVTQPPHLRSVRSFFSLSCSINMAVIPCELIVMNNFLSGLLWFS